MAAGNTRLEVYIDKNLKNEIDRVSKKIIINARTWRIFGKTRGSFWLEIAN